MSAKDLFFGFLDTVVYILLILFFVFYVFIGGRMELAQQIVKTGMVMSIFILLAMAKYRLVEKEKEYQEKNGTADELCRYIETRDLIQDQLVVITAALSIPILAVFFGGVDKIDVVQSLTVFSLVNIWHYYLFQVRDISSRIRFVTRGNEIADRIAGFVLPIIMIGLTLFDGGADLVDYSQTILVFLIFFFWHKYIFRS